MGRRGFAPQPTALKVLHGETRPSRLGSGEPQPREAPPEAPPWLTPEAREVWDRTVNELTHMGLAHAADADALCVYVNAVVNHAKAQQFLDRSGIMVRNNRDGGAIKNPANSVVTHNAAIISRYAREFGLTPSARVNLGTPRELEDSQSIAARLLS